MAKVPNGQRGFFEAGVRGYYRLAPDSRERTSLASWIALKHSVNVATAQDWLDADADLVAYIRTSQENL